MPPTVGAPGPWPASTKGWVITGGAAAVPGIPAAVLTVTTRTAAQPAIITVMVTVVIVSALVIVSSVVAVVYHARQETLRRRIDTHVRATIADALAACINDTHRHADDPTDQQSVAEARRVRNSARRLVAEQGTDILAHLTESPERRSP